MWNLDAAQQKYHTAICQQVKGCEDMGASIYKNRCGWCKSPGKAVPIVGSSLAYPFNSNTTCPANNLIIGSGNCGGGVSSSPGAVSMSKSATSIVNGSMGYGGLDQIEAPPPAKPCAPLPNGAYSRSCLLEKITSAGCKDEGSLYRGVRSGSDNDYLSFLRDQQSWSVYQQRAKLPLNESSLKSGKFNIIDTLNDIKKVEEQASSRIKSGLKFADRDLCYKQGEINQFDFCSEIQDVASGPFTLDCLQKAFLRGGGQIAGKAYPTVNNMTEWNSFRTWGDVKGAVQKMFSDTRSNNRKVQTKAMRDFYGIQMEQKKAIYGDPLRYVGGGDVQAYNDNRQIVVLNDGYFPPSPEGIGYTISGVDVPEGTTVVGYRFGKSNPSSRYEVIFMDLSNAVDGVNESNPVYYANY